MKSIVLSAVIMIFTVSNICAAGKLVVETVDEKINYSIGQQVGRDLINQNINMNPEILLQGIIDAAKNNQPLVSVAEQAETLATLKAQIVKSAEVKKAELKKKGQEFLWANADKKEVVQLESGLQYKILKKGDGATPKMTDTVRVNYVSKNVMDVQVSSSYKDGVSSPVEFQVNKVLPGWVEALQLMQVGDKWELYIPSVLAFQHKGPLAGQMIKCEVELLEIVAKN